MLKPVGNRILVRRAEAKKQIGGIHIPDTAQKKLFRGTVLAVGPGLYNPDGTFLPTCPVPTVYARNLPTEPPPQPVAGVVEGDTVIFGEWSGHEVEEGEDDGVTQPKLVVLEEGDVLLIVVPDPAPAAP